MPIILCCEGPRCNAGLDAATQERDLIAALPNQTLELRADAERYARAKVSATLARTPHTELNRQRGGRLLFRCDECGHERVYGGSYWAPYVGEGSERSRYFR